MRQNWEIIFSGIGGQGLVLSGNLLGEAASIYEGKNAVMSTSYGVETRGTFTKSDLIVSNEEIDFPEVLEPDLILALAPVAYNKYFGSMNENSILIYDSGVIEKMPSKATQYGYPIAEIATEMGNIASANILSLGIIVGKTKIVNKESVIFAIEKRFKGKDQVIKKNIEIFKRGLELSKK